MSTFETRERRYALLASAAVLHASLSNAEDGLASHGLIELCVDRAESLLAEIEKRERDAAQCEAIGNSKGDK